MKHVLTIQDLSCVGRCSLTVALPVLSAMGIRTSVLPTAVLSTHTAFADPEIMDLTGKMLDFSNHWKKNGISFDAISVGYLADPGQARIVGKILEDFSAFTVLDPVMGDNGRLYSRITTAHIDALRQLCRKADVVLPNLTEAAALTGLPYRELVDEAYLKDLTDGLLCLGAKAAVITGVHLQDGAIGYYGRGKEGAPFCYQGTLIPRQFHGTGDLFAAVLSGSLLQGSPLSDAAQNAAEFVAACVENTEKVTPFGVEFETQLYRLWK
jgi:pyridoxine kinase